jgi:hypothetical protein
MKQFCELEYLIKVKPYLTKQGKARFCSKKNLLNRKILALPTTQ